MNKYKILFSLKLSLSLCTSLVGNKLMFKSTESKGEKISYLIQRPDISNKE